MLKKLSDRATAATSKGTNAFESFTGMKISSSTSSQSSQVSELSSDLQIEEEEEKVESKINLIPQDTAYPKNDIVDTNTGEQTRRSSFTPLSNRFSQVNSENISAAATSMLGFMKKAQSAASIAAREGAAKAVVWKNKAIEVADLDNLQRKLSYAFDHSTGEVNLDLLNFSYVTDNIIAMGFPSMNTGGNRVYSIRENPIDLVSLYLNEKHGGHYMVWNLSEETYDYAYFDNQVLEFNFPGHPAPPLGLVFKICSSIENWLDADEQNVAAIHCLTGRGRTGTVIACYLAWVGLLPNAMEALEHVAEMRNIPVEKLTIPSQRRYIQYFTNVMEGVKPQSSPLLLRRVIMNGIPIFGTRKVLAPIKKKMEVNQIEEVKVDDSKESNDQTEQTETNEQNEGDQVEGKEKPDTNQSPAESDNLKYEGKVDEMQEVLEEGCCPYLQIFKGGKLLFTTTWADMEKKEGVKWVDKSEGSMSFNINCMLQGDVLLRCRHLTENGERVAMFRAAFHTGYVPGGILRLTKAQLDGAAGDDRFDQDFFVDLIFADVQTGPNGTDVTSSGEAPKDEGIVLNEEDRVAYEDMLHRDEAFWGDIEARKERLKVKREEMLKKKEAQAAAVAKAKAEKEALRLAEQAKQQRQKNANSFSITGDHDNTAPLSNVEKPEVMRRSSWNEEKDKALMSELESITSNAASSLDVAASKTSSSGARAQLSSEGISGEDDPVASLAKDFEEMKNSENEMGLDSSDSLNLDELDKEIEGLNVPAASGTGADELDFAADDFDELEQYLSGLSSTSK